VLVAAVLLGYFGLQLSGGVASDLVAGAALKVPASWFTVASWTVAGCALAFGLGLTPMGRRVRAALL
jgi:hypothetical protein